MWLRDNVPQVYEKTYKMLNAKDYILFKLTGKFVTEHSDGASTCLMDLRTLQWSDELLELGFNLNFAPVADVITNPNNTEIGNRAYSDDPQVAAAMVEETVSS